MDPGVEAAGSRPGNRPPRSCEGQRSKEEETRPRPGLRRSGGLTRWLPGDWPPSPTALPEDEDDVSEGKILQSALSPYSIHFRY